MNKFSRIITTLLVLASVCVWSLPAMAQDKAGSISSDEIVALNTKLAEAGKSASSARKKLAIRRVIREIEALIKKNPSAPNRYEVLHVLFRSQQAVVSLDNSAANRKIFLATCEKLAAAPNEYAAIRLDADLLLTQAKSARLGADSHARSDALRPLVERYRDTDVEAKVIRIAMIMALEFGNTKLVNDLRKVVAQRFPGDMELINFQREKLSTQVFGAPFIGTFQRGDGKTVRFPMDFLGTTTVLYCWSKENNGLEDLKALAAEWKKAKVEKKAAGRFQIVSMNMDDLPDAGEKILRGLGLDWQALKMPKGQDNPIYQTYIKRDTPTVLIVSPTGYVALYLSGGRNTGNYERRLQSMLASQWAQSGYASQLQSIFAGEFLVMPSEGDFDIAAPPEYKAIAGGDTTKQDKLPRTAASVPEDALRAIQACFIDPPLRYTTPHDQVIANYKKADALCKAAIAAHPEAPDLWVVRNRRITALIGLWKTNGDQEAFTSAVAEAKVAVEGAYPKGTDVVARLCLARQALLANDADPKAIIKDFVKVAGGKQASGPALLAASLLAMDTGDRLLHDSYRRTFLDKHADNPTMWTATAFLVDRYHRYRQYHPPFGAGWTYGRRQGYFLAIGTPEEAKRTFKTELKTLDGKTVKIPESSNGKWTVISFVPTAAGTGYIERYATFAAGRAFEDVNLIAAVLDDDADAAAKSFKEKEAKKRTKVPDNYSTLLVPDGIQNPIVRKLGILTDEVKPRNNILMLRPDGSIAVAMSDPTGSVIQNVIEFHDEELVDEALARKDLKEAKRLAFAHAPVKQVRPEDAPRNWKPKKIGVPHLRSRAKVYQAMGDLKAAFADAEQCYLAVNIKAGYISMRTDELEETEALRDTISATLKKQR
jgi:hypothetical protein